MRPLRILGLVGLLCVLVIGALVGVIDAAAAGGGPPGSTDGADAAAGPVPPDMAVLYVAAAATCPGLPASILAAIGTVESSNGTSDLPGVHSGANSAGAEGPMQFLPPTFAAYDKPVPAGGVDPPSPYDPVDAVYAAARMLCADGAAGGRNIAGAVFAYNHSDQYVTEVLDLAAHYELTGALASADAGPVSRPGCPPPSC